MHPEGSSVRVKYNPGSYYPEREWALMRSPDGVTWTQLHYPERFSAGTPSAVDEDPPVGGSFQYAIWGFEDGKSKDCHLFTDWLYARRDDAGALVIEYRPIDFAGMVAGLRYHAGM